MATSFWAKNRTGAMFKKRKSATFLVAASFVRKSGKSNRVDVNYSRFQICKIQNVISNYYFYSLVELVFSFYSLVE